MIKILKSNMKRQTITEPGFQIKQTICDKNILNWHLCKMFTPTLCFFSKLTNPLLHAHVYMYPRVLKSCQIKYMYQILNNSSVFSVSQPINLVLAEFQKEHFDS